MASDNLGNKVLDELESSYLPMFKAMLKEIKSEEVRRTLKHLVDAPSPAELEVRTKRLVEGSVREQAMIYVSAVTGAFSGHQFSRMWPTKILGVPVGSILGVGGMLTSLLAKTLAGRAALGVGGLMFAVGAFLGAS